MDRTFNTLDDGSIGDGFDNTVRTLSIQSDEKLIVGGDYLNLNGIPSPYLTRLNEDGSIDDSFNTGTGLNGKVYCSYIQPDGKIIIGGNFTAFNGITAGRLIRLNTDGSQDTSLNTSIGAVTGIIYKICPQSDGKIIIVGSFTKYNNVTVNRVARILSNGTLDTTFNTGSGSALNITNVEVLSNGKILLAGNFTSFNGVSANRIVRLFSDGRIDASFSIGIGFNDDVNAMTLQPDNKIILGGKFTSYNGITANRIIRLNQDGTPDVSFSSGSGLSKEAVQVLKTDASGNIMVGGSFTGTYNSSNVNRVFLLDANGILKDDFDIGSGPGSASVTALEHGADGSWFIGGSFSVFDSMNQGRLAKINADGEYDTEYLSAGIGFDNSVLKLLPLENKQTMVFGNFNKFNGVFSSKIARISENGTLHPTFNTGQSGANNLIKSAILQKDGKIVFGGNFTKYNGSAYNRIARIQPEGEIDPTFNTGSGFNGQIYSIAIQPDQKIIVGGNFTSYNGSPATRIIRLLPDGSRDSGFNVGLGANAIIDVILIQPDGKILVGGRFSAFDNNLFSGLVRLNTNGSIDSGFTIGTGFDKNVYAIALQSDQKIIIGGSFLNYNGISQKRILRLNTNGSLDTTFESDTGFSKGDVLSLLVQPDDKILAGGTFSGTYKTKPSLRLIRLLKSGEYDSGFQANLNGKLYTMNFTSDQKLMIGGSFNSVSGNSKHRIARLKICLESTVWNGIAWSNGLPSGGKEVTFKADYPNLTSAGICSCTIDKGKTVTLLDGNTLKIEFDYNGSGTLVLNDTAGLYQDDDEIVNSGIVQVKRKSSPILKLDYTYWSSPVQNQTLIDVSPNTSSGNFFSFNFLSGYWNSETSSNSMVPGKGYIIRGPQDFSTTSPARFEATFKGIPNNGVVNLELGNPGTYNLIGNPYPSAIDADLLIEKNIRNIKGTLYFWTHNTPFKNNKYTSDDYAVYNLLGGVGTRSSVSSGLNEIIPDGKIASGQAFFVRSKNSGMVEFNNSMRVEGQNSTFFKPGKENKNANEPNIKKHRFWLNLENPEGVFKQILIGYIEGMADISDYNAETFNANEFVNFYSILENKKLVIQGTDKIFSETDSVFLGYQTTVDGNFSLKIDDQDGLFLNQDIYIEDRFLNKIQNLKENPYLFSTTKGTFNDRFVLHYSDKALNRNNVENIGKTILIAVKNKSVKIVSPKENIQRIDIYDVSGKVIYTKNKIDQAEYQTPDLPFSNQVFIIKIALNNYTFTQKIILE
ncbi:calcium-binding protein [Flavobacterium sp. HTF]|nr:calcium-binding protein [Flavobacterium sp. HTF]